MWDLPQKKQVPRQKKVVAVCCTDFLQLLVLVEKCCFLKGIKSLGHSRKHLKTIGGIGWCLVIWVNLETCNVIEDRKEFCQIIYQHKDIYLTFIVSWVFRIPLQLKFLGVFWDLLEYFGTLCCFCLPFLPSFGERDTLNRTRIHEERQRKKTPELSLLGPIWLIGCSPPTQSLWLRWVFATQDRKKDVEMNLKNRKRTHMAIFVSNSFELQFILLLPATDAFTRNVYYTTRS